MTVLLRYFLLFLSIVYAAHEEAWKKAQVLHRDISLSNILIDIETGEGILNDWDLAKYKKHLESGPTRHAFSVNLIAIASF